MEYKDALANPSTEEDESAVSQSRLPRQLTCSRCFKHCSELYLGPTRSVPHHAGTETLQSSASLELLHGVGIRRCLLLRRRGKFDSRERPVQRLIVDRLLSALVVPRRRPFHATEWLLLAVV